MHLRYATVLHILTLYGDLCQLYFNKAGEKSAFNKYVPRTKKLQVLIGYIFLNPNFAILNMYQSIKLYINPKKLHIVLNLLWLPFSSFKNTSVYSPKKG